MNWLLTALLLVNILFFVGLLLITVKITIHYKKIRSVCSEFLIPPKDGEPSPAASMVKMVSDILGSSVAIHIKTSLMGKASGEARLNKAVEGDITEAILSQHPLAKMLMDASPGLRKKARANPGVAQMILSKFGGMQGFQMPLGAQQNPVEQPVQGSNNGHDYEAMVKEFE